METLQSGEFKLPILRMDFRVRVSFLFIFHGKKTLQILKILKQGQTPLKSTNFLCHASPPELVFQHVTSQQAQTTFMQFFMVQEN